MDKMTKSLFLLLDYEPTPIIFIWDLFGIYMGFVWDLFERFEGFFFQLLTAR